MFVTSSWIRRLNSRFTGGRIGPGTTRRRALQRPCLEHLEDRRVLNYSITDLGTLGGTFSIPLGMNSRGAVVGLSYTAKNADEHAFLAQHGTMTDLGTLGGSNAEAQWINLRGNIVGISPASASSDQPEIFLYSHGQLRSLTSLDMSSFEGGNVAINDSGEFIGFRLSNGDAALERHGKLIDLGSLGGQGSGAMALNNKGQVAGYSVTSGSGSGAVTHAFLYTHGKMTDLGTLGGSFAVGDAINVHGAVVGVSFTSSGNEHAFLSRHGAMADLGTLGGSASSAVAINDSGIVVGNSLTSGASRHAFVYSHGTMTDLDTLIPASSGFTLVDATAINDKGQIAAEAVSTNSQDSTVYAVLLTPSKGNR